MTQRQEYLDALGITHWVSRAASEATPDAGGSVAQTELSTAPEPAPPMTEPARTAENLPAKAPAKAPVKTPAKVKTARALGMILGPGQGSCLFLCGADDDLATPMASDIARLVSGGPVWAQTARSDDGISLETAIAERLFTTVVVFGQAQALLALGGEVPEQCGPARVLVAPELKRLASDAAARKACWQSLKSVGLSGRKNNVDS